MLLALYCTLHPLSSPTKRKVDLSLAICVGRGGGTQSTPRLFWRTKEPFFLCLLVVVILIVIFFSLQQVILKNRHLKEIIDHLRRIIWEINTMLTMRRS